MYSHFKAEKIPRYEIGEHKGVKFCAECHEEIYNQWFQNSAHAVATTDKDFLVFRDKFTGNLVWNAVAGEEWCYACHGSKEVNEGVDCETCHGTVIPNVSIEETHERKFNPGLASLRKPEFCAKCHEMKVEEGESFMEIYSEWQRSEAAKQGLTCQKCHMKPRENQLSYHGFDSVNRSIEIYRDGDQLSIEDVKLNFPQFSLAIENHVTSHAIPASGPSRVLMLEISFLNSEGVEIYKIVETFAKKGTLTPIIGLMPYKLIENTQLKSSEVRPLNYALPYSLEGQVSKAVLTLRFYDVSDEHLGDINKAHWISEPFLEEEVIL